MAPTKTHWSSITAKILIGDDEFPLVEYQTRWGLNEMPAGGAVVAPGRNVIDKKISALHTKATSMGAFADVKILQTIKGDDGSGSWNESETVVFEGKLAGLGLRKTGGQAQPMLHLVHWLSDLNFSSTVSQQSFPDNPFAFNYRADPNMPAAGGSQPVGLSSMRALEFFTDDNCATDLWGKAIKPFLLALTAEDTINDLAAPGVAIPFQKNDLAKAALDRFDLRGVVPLSMSFPQDAAARFALGQGIGSSISTMSEASVTQRTMWDFIVGALAPYFWFSLVPLVDTALVVPFTAGLQSYRKTIKESEYDFSDLTNSNPRPLRGVGVFSSAVDNHGVTDPGNPAGEVPNVIAFYSPPDVKTGMIRFIAPPPWMAIAASSLVTSGATTGVAQAIAPNFAMAPVAANAANLSQNTSASVALAMSDVYKRYAHSAYINSMLSDRLGAVSGKLRYDIAPGDTVRVEGSKDPLIEQDQVGEDIVASVMRVSIGVNAQTGTAGTGFQLAHIRRLSENTDEAYSTNAHPLYGPKSIYNGISLVKNYG